MNEQIVKLINDYQPTQETIEIVKRVPKVFIVGIAGAGKNVMINQLLKTDKFHYIVSHVTRPPRENNGTLEKEGVEYHFITMDQAFIMLENHEFVEAKWVHRQNAYATSPKEFTDCESEGKVAIADIDVAGVEEYMKISPETTKPIFILPPDFSTWQQRFKSRYEGRLGEGEFQRRMFTAAQEIEQVLSKNYYSIIINDDLDDAVTQVLSIANGEPQPDSAWRHGSKVAHQLLEAMRTSTR